MAKYNKKVQELIEEKMHELKEDKHQIGGDKKAKKPKQSEAIAVSEARKKVEKLSSPRKKERDKLSGTSKAKKNEKKNSGRKASKTIKTVKKTEKKEEKKTTKKKIKR